nr:reverse transcriptase domain-containing protein [Tanacetum cinerariifolium]
MSSPNHHTSNIKDAFFSNFLDYIPVSTDYVSASLGKTYSSSSNNSFGLVLIASPTLSLFHDDPYMKVMHAYYDKESPIPPPVIMPPSPMLSPMFSFFLKNYCHLRNIDVTDHPPLLLPYLKNLRYDKALVRQAWNVMRNKLRKSRITLMSYLSTALKTSPTMTQAAIRKLVADSITTALEAQAANMENADNTNRNLEPREAPVARKYSYKEFMSCQPFNFKGSEGAVGLICWFEHSLVFLCV